MNYEVKPHQHQQPNPLHSTPAPPKAAKTLGWLTIEEAADYASVSKRTIRNWFKKGLKHVRQNHKTVRIRPTDIDEFLLRDYSDMHPVIADLNVKAIVSKITSRKS